MIVTDDQPIGTMDALPFTLDEIGGDGVKLVNGMVPTSLCCPSRASLLTGNYAHTTGVYTNSEKKYGAWLTFHNAGDEDSTLATHLDAVGYRTGMFGKYMNGWAESSPPDYVPPGWDKFVSFKADNGSSSAYFDYTLDGTIAPVHYGSTAADYSTDVVGRMASNFIRSTPASEPVFLYFAPYGSHAPYTPAPRDVGTWPLEPASAIPALNEANVSDKPAWVQSRGLVPEWGVRHNLTLQHETLLSVDDAVRKIVAALGDRESNTLFIFLSDNGYMLGSHRITGKDVPYNRSTRVPMLIRWDGVLPAGIEDSRITTNIDLTATIAEAAGASWPMDGMSYLSTNRRGTLLEQLKYGFHPAYCGYRNHRYLFVHYTNDIEELYDYRVDPNELRNKISNPDYAATVERLRAIAVKRCDPVPPGFSWS